MDKTFEPVKEKHEHHKPTRFVLKGYAGRHISKGYDPTDADRTMMYNGIPVKWFIGDINLSRAIELGCCIKEKEATRLVNPNGAYWEAWGSCLGKAYQLSAWFNQDTSELTDIKVCEDAENYNKLTN